MSLLCCSLFSLAHSVRMSFRKHYSLTGNKGKLERLGNVSPGRVLPATDLAAQDPGTTNASLPNAAIKCSGEKPTHTYFWHIHITAPQASTSADSSTAENSTIAAMWRLCADRQQQPLCSSRHSSLGETRQRPTLPSPALQITSQCASWTQEIFISGCLCLWRPGTRGQEGLLPPLVG